MAVIRAAFTVGVFTLFSRVAGYLRECIMAACLGASIYTDALLVALRIANTFRRIFAEGAFNASFLPRFSNILNKEGKDSANVVLVDVFSFLLISLLIFSGVVICFFPTLFQFLVVGFDTLSEKFELTVKLGRICFPYLILISLSSLFSGVLNTINKFALPAALYSLLSISTGGGLLICHFLDCSKYVSVHVMSYCVLASGLIQSYWLFCSIKNYGFRLNFNFFCWNSKVKDIMKNMIPGIIGAGVWQLNMLIDTAISSYLPTGTITCINLADRLNQFPLGTLGVALSTALLPILSKYITLKDYETARLELERGLLFAFFLTFFATTLLISLDDLIVSVAFQRGLFGEEQVLITSTALVGFTVGLPAYILSKIYGAVFFAARDTKTPVLFAMISVALNAFFLIILVPFFKYFGLTLCLSLSITVNAILLIYFLDERLKIDISRSFLIKISSQIVAALVTFFVLSYLKNIFWSLDLGLSSIKWVIFFSMFLVSIVVFLGSTIAYLFVFKQQNWKLWRKDAWSN